MLMRRLVVSSFVLSVALAAATASAQDDLTAARDLYRAAAYDDALTLLNKMQGSSPEADAVVEQYRALCLLALGRPAEAERAMEAAVADAPAFRPSSDDASPRMRSAFGDVRRRVLPAIIQRKYADAKRAFDRKESAAAASEFEEVLALLADPDLTAAVGQPPLSSLRALAMDFSKLSRAAATPPPPPNPPAPQPPAVAPVPVVPVAPTPPMIYGEDDARVVPPITLRQVLPPVGEVFAVRQGVVEVVIDETGAVESAVMRAPVNPVYDRLVISSTKTWRYRAATLDGKPVKFRKIVRVDIKPR